MVTDMLKKLDEKMHNCCEEIDGFSKTENMVLKILLGKEKSRKDITKERRREQEENKQEVKNDENVQSTGAVKRCGTQASMRRTREGRLGQSSI
jgi:hypothetical protein